MRYTKVGLALLVLLLSAVLGATALREPIAFAGSPFQRVIVSNTKDEPVPVEQHGTASVYIANSSLPVAAQVPVTGGGGHVQADGGQAPLLTRTATASALAINFYANASSVALVHDGQTVAEFDGPASDVGTRNYQLALTRPVSFDQIHCFGALPAACGVSWVGNEP